MALKHLKKSRKASLGEIHTQETRWGTHSADASSYQAWQIFEQTNPPTWAPSADGLRCRHASTLKYYSRAGTSTVSGCRPRTLSSLKCRSEPERMLRLFRPRVSWTVASPSMGTWKNQKHLDINSTTIIIIVIGTVIFLNKLSTSYCENRLK